MGVSIAIYSGSFDPVTNGHVCVIETASKIFDQLIIAVGTNPGKQYMFTIDERMKLIENMPVYKDIYDKQDICVVPFENQYLMEFAEKECHANYIVRGIRSESDYKFEREMMDINQQLFGIGIETVYLFPPTELQSVSSSMVKGLIGYKGWETKIRPFVQPNVRDAIIKKVNGK